MGLAKSALIALEVLAYGVYAGGVALTVLTTGSATGLFEGTVLGSLVFATGVLLVAVLVTDYLLP